MHEQAQDLLLVRWVGYLDPTWEEKELFLSDARSAYEEWTQKLPKQTLDRLNDPDQPCECVRCKRKKRRHSKHNTPDGDYVPSQEEGTMKQEKAEERRRKKKKGKKEDKRKEKTNDMEEEEILNPEDDVIDLTHL